MEKKHQGLSAGHLTMMALGSVIGGSFFIGTAVAINAAGPAVLISYALGGILIYFILYALSEMTVANPHSGSFRTLAARYFGPGTGFVVGWVYWTGMIFSGFAMLLTLWLGLLFPRVYLFLISSGGFALLFTYAVILAIHIRFRKMYGCPPEGKCQMPGFPYSSWLALMGTIVIILSMPLISGQESGLIAGIAMVALFSLIYVAMKFFSRSQVKNITDASRDIKRYHGKLATEFSKELTEENNKKDKVKPIKKC